MGQSKTENKREGVRSRRCPGKETERRGGAEEVILVLKLTGVRLMKGERAGGRVKKGAREIFKKVLEKEERRESGGGTRLLNQRRESHVEKCVQYQSHGVKHDSYIYFSFFLLKENLHSIFRTMSTLSLV